MNDEKIILMKKELFQNLRGSGTALLRFIS